MIGPRRSQLLRVDRGVECKNFTNVNIGSVQRILLPKSVFAQCFAGQAAGRIMADVHLVKVIHHAAMIHIRMRQQQALGNSIVARDHRTQYTPHFFRVTSIAAVNAQ